MKLNSKVTWGLAWAGLALVLIVPSADFLTGKLGDGTKAAVLTSTAEPVQTAAIDATETASVTTQVTPNGIIITPKRTTAPASTDAVDKYVQSGRPLPDYISDGKTGAGATKSAPSAATEPTKVAVVDPAPVATPVAPTPFPSWARPKPAPARAASEPVVIVDDDLYARDAAIGTTPAPTDYDQGASDDDESLRDYLEQRGILEGGGSADRSTATVTVRDRDDSECDVYDDEYDPDGFYLSDGPNSDCDRAARRQARLDALFGDDPSF